MKPSVIVFLVLLLTGCGLLPEVIDETKGWSAQKLYSEAKSELGSGNYEKSIKLFETLEARYPYGRYAQQAQLEVAYAYYKDNEPVSAVAACDRFIKLHPNHPNVDYAYYLKGLASFNEDTSLLARLGDQDLSERDPKSLRESFEAFKELATHYPDSKYAPDAVARMNYLINAMASHEIHIARYYMKRGAWLAAANRAKEALSKYPQAPAIEEGLAIMVDAYDKLGLDDLRDDALRVFKQNFPNSDWLAGGPKAKSGPWWKIW